MINLPLWVLPDNFPSVYESESFTTLEMVSKLYGAMRTFTEEYNKFAENTNKEINEFMESSDKNYELFTRAMRQEFQDFIGVVELKLMGQDKEIDDLIKYVKNNLSQAVTDIITQMRDSGELSEDIMTAFDDMKDMVDSLSKRVNELHPQLTSTDRKALSDLMAKYRNNSTNFYYENKAHRNIYQDSGCYKDGKTAMNCGLFCQLIWSGIDPDTFLNKESTYDGTLVKAFDWGYEFRFPNRIGYGKTREDGTYYGFTKPKEDSFEGSFSYNSYYDDSASNEYKQIFKSFVHASDMANELYLMGCEIDIKEVQVGDMVFFKARTDDGFQDELHKLNFRNIGHSAIVSNVDRKNEGLIGFVASSGYYTNQPSITNPWSSVEGYTMRAIELNNTICMVARHPKAFGITSPVGDKFTVY